MLGVPAGVWSWHRTTLLMLMVAVPFLAAVTLTVEQSGWRQAGLLSAMLAAGVLLVASGLLFVRWRIDPDPRQAWLLMLMAAAAVDAMTRTGLRALASSSYDDQIAWLMVLDVVVVVGALALLLLAQRVVLTVDPLPAGLALGAAVGATRVVLALVAPPVRLPREAEVVAGLTLIFLVAAVALALLRLRGVPEWARAGVALAVVLLSLAQAMAYHYPLDPARAVITVAVSLTGALLLAGVTAALLLQTVRGQRRELRWLQGRLLEAEARQRRESERMHDIAGTVAGIVSATRLLRDSDALSGERRVQLDALVDAEIERLQQLIASRHDEDGRGDRVVDLDETIYPLVVAQQARGNRVQWRPSGLHARVPADDISTVVNVLLDNVARHAPGSEAVVEVRRADETVEIRVADRGPGVPEEAREHLFEPASESSGRGPSGPAAHGLEFARRLVLEQGGYLRLAETTPSRGAEFVIGLPVAHRRDDGRGRRGARGLLAGSRRRGGPDAW